MNERAVGRGSGDAGVPGAGARRGLSRVRRMVANLRGGYAYGTAVLGEPIVVAGAIAAVKARLRARADVFLNVVERGIFGTAESPYRPLLAAAGYDLARVRALVRAEGVEPALRRLCQDGVYVSIEEFKGLRPAQRGAQVFRFHERDFHNPLSQSEFRIPSGGTRSPGFQSAIPAAHLRINAEHFAVHFAANGLENLPAVVWFPQMERVSLLTVMALAAMRHVPARWFTQVPGWRLAGADGTHAYYCGINLAARARGLAFPSRTYVPLGQESRALSWIAGQARRNGCVVVTIPSAAHRLAVAARRAGTRLANVTFITSGEAMTPAKAAAIETVGARVRPRFAFAELGTAAYGCASPARLDEMHVCQDAVAVIQRRRVVDADGSEVDALVFTSLGPEARRLLLNVETGDYGTLTTRRCGCLMEQLGWTAHLADVWSFEKLNLEGWAFFGTKLVVLVEEVLPARFGGDSTDYQLVEHEGEDGQTRLTVIAHPRLGTIDETAVLCCVEEALDVSPSWVSAGVYRRLKTLQVRRAVPMLTAEGKVMPLHHLGAGWAIEAPRPTDAGRRR